LELSQSMDGSARERRKLRGASRGGRGSHNWAVSSDRERDWTEGKKTAAKDYVLLRKTSIRHRKRGYKEEE